MNEHNFAPEEQSGRSPDLLSPEVAGRSQLFVPTSFEDARELRIPVQVRQNADLDDIPFRDGGMVRDSRFTGLGSMGYML